MVLIWPTKKKGKARKTKGGFGSVSFASGLASCLGGRVQGGRSVSLTWSLQECDLCLCLSPFLLSIHFLCLSLGICLSVPLGHILRAALKCYNCCAVYSCCQFFIAKCHLGAICLTTQIIVKTVNTTVTSATCSSCNKCPAWLAHISDLLLRYCEHLEQSCLENSNFVLL